MPHYRGIAKPKHKLGPNCADCMYGPLGRGYVGSVGPRDTVLIIGEGPGANEVVEGIPFAGKSGTALNKIIINHCAFSRGQMRITNAVRCRPVKFGPDGEPLIGDYGDYVNNKPSTAMVRECGARYLDDELTQFTGSIIYGLGAVAQYAMLGREQSIKEYQGSIYEYGEMIDCPKCEGTKRVSGGNKKCPECKGKGHTTLNIKGNQLSCVYHRSYHGKVKPKRGCDNCWGVWKHYHPECMHCTDGKVPRPDKPCRHCGVSGEVPANPEKKFICKKLKPDQLFMPTLHPSYLMRDPTQFPVVERDFARMHQLKQELIVETELDYWYDPDEHQKTMLLYKPMLSIDLETNGKMGAPDTKITHISVSPTVKESYLIDPRDPVARDILEHPYIIGQNWLQADAWEVWRTYGIKFKTLWDTRLGGHLLNPDTPNNLVYLSREFATPPARGYWKTKEDYKERKDNVALVDADVTYRVYAGQYDAMVSRGVLDIMEHHIMPLSNVLLDMRIAGMRLDRSTLDSVTKIMEVDVTELRKELPDWPPTKTGERTENQNAHVADYLYGKLGVPVQTKRGEGSVTTDKETLLKLKDWLDIGHKKIEHLTHQQVEAASNYIKLHLSLKSKSKLKSEFTKYRDTGVEWLHPTLNPAGTGTFRFSASNPNIQQIAKCRCKPKCYGLNPECRGARHVFLPDEDDWLIVRFDLKQAEVVTFLWYAQEWEILAKVLKEGADTHQLIADKMGLDRDSGKTCTFATLFDASMQNVAARMQRTVAQVEDMFAAFHKALPGVEDYRAHFINMAMSKGYVETPFRTRRFIRVNYPKGRAARQAGNAPIQSVPPWVLRRAMLKIADNLPKPAHLWSQLHDEVDIVTPPDLLDEVIDCARTYITAPVPELGAGEIGMHQGLEFASGVEVGPNFGALFKLEHWREYAKAKNILH